MIDLIALDSLKRALEKAKSDDFFVLCADDYQEGWLPHDEGFDLDLLRDLVALASNDAADPATVEEAFRQGYREGRYDFVDTYQNPEKVKRAEDQAWEYFKREGR